MAGQLPGDGRNLNDTAAYVLIAWEPCDKVNRRTIQERLLPRSAHTQTRVAKRRRYRHSYTALPCLSVRHGDANRADMHRQQTLRKSVERRTRNG